MSGVVVNSRGPRRPGVNFIVGERPGYVEASTGRPFSGPSGREQDRYLSQGGLSSTQFYITNVCRDYDDTNADPTPADIARWSPALEHDLAELRPKFIITAGRFATRWFLGDDVDMEAVHGTPQRVTYCARCGKVLVGGKEGQCGTVLVVDSRAPREGLRASQEKLTRNPSGAPSVLCADQGTDSGGSSSSPSVQEQAMREPRPPSTSSLIGRTLKKPFQAHPLSSGSRDDDKERLCEIGQERRTNVPHLRQIASEAHSRPHSPVYTIAVPVFHPAYGLHDDEARVSVSYGYSRACAIIQGRASREPVVDAYEGHEEYLDVSGVELHEELMSVIGAPAPLPLALDTEGTPDQPWSIQVTRHPGRAIVLRCTRRDFAIGVAAVGLYARQRGGLTVLHSGMYDIEMCRAMGINLSTPDIRLFDTRYAAYIMRVEPQGLKPLLKRWCGMTQPSYDDTIGPIALEKQLAYLGTILETDGTWGRPDPRIKHSNDGTSRLYTPQPVERRAEAILVDYYSGKTDKSGNRVDPYKRWRQVDGDLRRMVEQRLGPMPVGTLDDIALADAVKYSCRDADGTLRLYYKLAPALYQLKLDQLMSDGMRVLPVFEEMQSNGMLADRHYCERKSDDMWQYMCKVANKISSRYYQGQPFNPASSDQVAALMRRRGLVGEKRSKKTGKMSTAKKSIEHLRYSDDAMADVIDWREHQKMRDAFYDPIIERLGEQAQGRIRTHINPYKVTSRRISSSDPNLTAIPVRNELGVEVRDGFIAPPGMRLGSYDLSQIEMRYMCHLSNDPLMRKFFTSQNPATGKDYDMHAETAARIFGIDIRDVDEKKHRYPAKRAGFGIITNIMGAGLLDQLRMFGCDGWTVDKCDELIEEWLNVYKGVKSTLEGCKAEVRETGVVYDCWGMPRHLPGVWSDDKRVKAEAERAASSHKIQGGAQGMIQHSMAWLHPYVVAMREGGVNVRWLLQIHDEIIVECDEEYTDVVGELCVEALTQHNGITLNVPVKASGRWAQSWGELK